MFGEEPVKTKSKKERKEGIPWGFNLACHVVVIYSYERLCMFCGFCGVHTNVKKISDEDIARYNSTAPTPAWPTPKE